MSKILPRHPADSLSIAELPSNMGCPFNKGYPGKPGHEEVGEQTKYLSKCHLVVQCEPVQSTIKVELCSMNSVMHNNITSKNVEFFALLKPQVPVQEVQSLYPELAKLVDVLC